MPKMTKNQRSMAAVIDLLLAAEFVPDGETRQEHVRIPTANAPVFGQSGGVLATLGGRQRFVKSGTTIKATVGPRTTALYRIEGAGIEGVRGIATLATKN
jgi:hypothetical protein